jgi:hypothetical protein
MALRESKAHVAATLLNELPQIDKALHAVFGYALTKKGREVVERMEKGPDFEKKDPKIIKALDGSEIAEKIKPLFKKAGWPKGKKRPKRISEPSPEKQEVEATAPKPDPVA